MLPFLCFLGLTAFCGVLDRNAQTTTTTQHKGTRAPPFLPFPSSSTAAINHTHQASFLQHKAHSTQQAHASSAMARRVMTIEDDDPVVARSEDEDDEEELDSQQQQAPKKRAKKKVCGVCVTFSVCVHVCVCECVPLPVSFLNVNLHGHPVRALPVFCAAQRRRV